MSDATPEQPTTFWCRSRQHHVCGGRVVTLGAPTADCGCECHKREEEGRRDE
ncbi:hypothetical protein GCM10009785_13690 [Brooklawnia cerclae]